MLLGSGDHRWSLKDDGKIHRLIGTHLSESRGEACMGRRWLAVETSYVQKSEQDPGRAQWETCIAPPPQSSLKKMSRGLCLLDPKAT